MGRARSDEGTDSHSAWGSTSSEVVSKYARSLALVQQLREIEHEETALKHIRSQLLAEAAVDRADLYLLEGDAFSQVGFPDRPAIPVTGSSFESAVRRRQSNVWMTLPRPTLPGDHEPVADGMQSSLMIPLVARGAVVGIIVLYSTSAYAFRVADARGLAALVDHTAQVFLWRRLNEAEASLRSAQEALAAREKLAAVGRLGAGIAHEVNNPAAAVLTNLEWLASQLDMLGAEPARARELIPETKVALEDALQAIKRIRDIVADLSVFARRSDLTLESLDVNDIVEASLKLSAGDLRARARVELQLAQSLPPVTANRTRLVQVVLNLISNAFQAFANHDDPSSNVVRVSTKRDADHVRIVVEDNGVGLTPEALAHAFEPFFSTKSEEGGMGLGLAISRSIVCQLGGTITFASQPGVGTTFSASLPIQIFKEERQADQPARKAAVAPSARRTRVLVVDDEAAILRALRRGLGERFDVVTVSSAEEAMAHLSTLAVDVIISDVHLGGMSGLALYDHVCRHFPDRSASMVLMTGGAVTTEAHKLITEHKPIMLRKPIELDTLMNVIDSIAAGDTATAAVVKSKPPPPF